MLNYIIWSVSFFSLYIALIWINILFIHKNTNQTKKLTDFPKVTIAVPAYNEEKHIIKTIQSISRLDYPEKKLEIIIVNDGSTDTTGSLVSEFIKNHKNIKLINQINKGKAAALNTALKSASGELFGCVDADSIVDKKSLKYMISHFHDKKTGAVISALRVIKPTNFFEKIQRLEYIIAILSRKLRASINTLAMTPGVLSLYSTSILRKLKGFDANNLTEDFEIALRLKYNGYNIMIEPKSLTYTKVPSNLRSFWRQRIRWYRGFIYNHIIYRDMFFNKRHGLMGYFQFPLNILGVIILFTSIFVISYEIIRKISEEISRILNIQGYLTNHLFYIPSFKDFFLKHNTKIMLPIFIASLAGLFLFYIAHRQTKEKIRFPFSIFTYFILYPYFVTTEWVSAIVQEFLRFKRRW